MTISKIENLEPLQESRAKINQVIDRVNRRFETFADLQDNTETTLGAVGSVIEAGGFRYQITDATDQHVTTAGGVKFYVLQTQAGDKAAQSLGAINNTIGLLSDIAGDSTSAFASTIAASQYASGIAAGGRYIVGDLLLKSHNIKGPGVLKALSGANAVLRLGRDGAPTNGWRPREVSDLYIDGDGRASHGVVFSDDASPELSGRWTLRNMFIADCDVAIDKPFGNIGNIIVGVATKRNNIAYRAVDQASPVMQAGADTIIGGEWAASSLAAFLIDSDLVGTGGTKLIGCVIEGNAGFGVFVKNWRSSVVPFTLDGVWFEGNATAASVTIDGVAYTPRDIRFDNMAYGVINGSQLRQVEFNNACVLLDNCFLDDQTVITQSGNNSLRFTNANTDGFKAPVVIESLSTARRDGGNFANAHQAPARKGSVRKLHGSGVARMSRSMGGSAAWTIPGTSTLTSTQVLDGDLNEWASEFTHPTGHTGLLGSATITDGKWYVYTADWKQVSGTLATLRFQNATTLAVSLENARGEVGQWATVGGVARAGTSGVVALRMTNTSGSDQVFRVRNVQVVEFDTEGAALAFYNAHLFAATEVLQNTGVTTATTDGSGNIVISHGLARTPSNIVPVVRTNLARIATAHTFTSTTFTVTVRTAVDGTPSASTEFTIMWDAEV